jgi:hypothetical protein
MRFQQTPMKYGRRRGSGRPDCQSIAGAPWISLINSSFHLNLLSFVGYPNMPTEPAGASAFRVNHNWPTGCCMSCEDLRQYVTWETAQKLHTTQLVNRTRWVNEMRRSIPRLSPLAQKQVAADAWLPRLWGGCSTFHPRHRHGQSFLR